MNKNRCSSRATFPAVTTILRSFFLEILGGGRPLLFLAGISLVLSGVFAVFLGITGHFLPHDVQFLGMTAEQLCAVQGCRIVHFIIHDRVSFGGALIAIGLLYMWLVAVPLRKGQAWAWWLLLVSGVEGFGSFLAYLGYGYLDSWHGVATLALLPCFVLGLLLAYRRLRPPTGISSLFQPGIQLPSCSARVGQAFLLATAAGMVVGGLTILVVGMTCVFVPQDLAYLGLSVDDLQSLNPRLIPLIAHDRAGFGGGVCCSGIIIFFCVWCGEPSRNLWRVLGVAVTVGFATAIGVHPAVGYNDMVHLAPAVCGAAVFLAGLLLTLKPMGIGNYPSLAVPGGVREDQR